MTTDNSDDEQYLRRALINDVPVALTVALGRLTVFWSQLDTQLSILLSILRFNEKVRELTRRAPFTYSQKIDLLRDAAERAFKSTDLKGFIAEFCDDYDKLLRQRNLLTHGDWTIPPPSKETGRYDESIRYIILDRYNDAKVGWDEVYDAAVEEINELCVDVLRLNRRISDALFSAQIDVHPSRWLTPEAKSELSAFYQNNLPDQPNDNKRLSTLRSFRA